MLGFILVLFPVATVFAIPNPSATYCVDLGYTYEDGNCIFPDETYCPGWEFYNGECGTDYAQEMECKEAGEPIGVSSCCEGLTLIANDEPGEINMFNHFK